MLVPEFGEDAGKLVLIVRALYGPNIYGADLGIRLSYFINHMGYMPCLSEPDLWMNPIVGSDDGFGYWGCIFCCISPYGYF